MNNAFPIFDLKTVAIKFPTLYIKSKRKARDYSKSQQNINILYYGYTSIIVFSRNAFSHHQTVCQQIISHINTLVFIGIIEPSINPFALKIHRIELDYRFENCLNPFFCRIDGFRLYKNHFLSRDFREKGVKPGKGYKSKQRSLMCFSINDNSSNLTFVLSGKYVSKIVFQHLDQSIEDLPFVFQTLLSITLSQATNPTNFLVNMTTFQFFDDSFKSIIQNAGWFSAQFIHQRLTSNKWGVPDSYY